MKINPLVLENLLRITFAISLRYVLYAIPLLALLLLQVIQGPIRYEFLIMTIFSMALMHESLHLVGMEMARAEHYENITPIAITYELVDLSIYGTALTLFLPYIVILPLSYWLTTTGVATFMAVGWAVMITQLVLFAVELFSLRFLSSRY